MRPGVKVSYKPMSSAWRKLWPKAVTARDFEGFKDDPGSPIVGHTVSLGKSMVLEVSEDVEELVEKHRAELSTGEQQEFQQEQQQRGAGRISSGVEE